MADETAILMAAGLGQRMRPLTDKMPKPLVPVHGKPMIETVIDGLRGRGVNRFIVVTGYLAEQFGYLEDKYENLTVIKNEYFMTVNNISSIYAASDILVDTDSDVFICEADLYVSDRTIFDAKLTRSCYYGRMVKGHSDDWLFEQDENGRITRVGKGGDDLYNMVGIAYFTRDDARCLGRCIKDAWGKEGYEDLFWDDVVDRNLDKLDLTVHPVNEGQLVEIDTVEELALVDPSYSRRQ